MEGEGHLNLIGFLEEDRVLAMINTGATGNFISY
jgi:hypothetical protein